MPAAKKHILLLGDQHLADGKLAACFTECGFSVKTQNDSDIPPLAILVCAKQWTQQFATTIQNIKTRFKGRVIPVLAVLDETTETAEGLIDSLLLTPANIQQIVSRTDGMVRLSGMQIEIGLRLQTLQENFGISIDRPQGQTKSQFSILFIGKASPEFMVIINALQRKNVDVTAAFTSFTAFDYLYEKTFDAVVMNGLDDTEPAFSITQTMRKNAKLYTVPALLLVKGNTKLDTQKVYEKGFNDIIIVDAPHEEISARVLEQANFHRLHQNLKAEFSALGGTQCVDQTSMLFNRAFFDAHIARVSKHCEKMGQPLSICLIKLRTETNKQTPTPGISYMYHQVASMIKNLVRMQDIAARLDRNLFAIAFPGQTVKQLEPVAERLSSIISCATVNDPQTNKPLKLKLEISFEALIPDEKHTSSVA